MVGIFWEYSHRSCILLAVAYSEKFILSIPFLHFLCVVHIFLDLVVWNYNFEDIELKVYCVPDLFFSGSQQMMSETWTCFRLREKIAGWTQKENLQFYSLTFWINVFDEDVSIWMAITSSIFFSSYSCLAMVENSIITKALTKI